MHILLVYGWRGKSLRYVVFSVWVKFTCIYTFNTCQAAVYCVWSCHALQKMHTSSSSVKTFTLASIGDVPYENRFVRHLVDSCAFHIYGHWVKRGEEQNRALLFETAPKKLSQFKAQSLSGFVRPKILWSH